MEKTWLFRWYKSEYGPLTLPYSKKEPDKDNATCLVFKTYDWIKEPDGSKTFKRLSKMTWDSLDIWMGQLEITKEKPNQSHMHALIIYLFESFRPDK